MPTPDSDTGSTKKPGRMSKAASITSATLGLKYYNPRRWIGTGYKTGSVLGHAMSNLKSTWKIGSGEGARKETFEQAVARMGLSKADLAARAQEYKMGSRVCYGTAACILMFTAVQAALGNTVGAIAGIFLAVATTQSGLLRAHRLWQVQSRRLGSYKEFIVKPEHWFI